MESLAQSIEDFDRLVRPIAAEKLSGRFVTVEGIGSDQTSRDLDTNAGIDLWLFHREKQVLGVANRVQRQEKNWRTFTIRKERDSGHETEHAKRKKAIENEMLFPTLTLHAYVTPDGASLFGFAVARTRDLLTMIEDGHCYVRRTRCETNDGLASFYVVEWDRVRRSGYEFYEYPEPTAAVPVEQKTKAVVAPGHLPSAPRPQMALFPDLEVKRLRRF